MFKLIVKVPNMAKTNQSTNETDNDVEAFNFWLKICLTRKRRN